MNNRFKKLVASLLVMVMFMSILPVTTLDGIVAQAASDVIDITSPDDGSTITGKKSLTVKWAKVDGADYYLFSARNLTTDAEIATRVDTGTTRSYKISASDLPYNSRFRFWVGAFDAAGNQIAGSDTNYEVNTYPIIDGYFGNNSYTMELGETLDVKVNASVENANLTRATITIDSSGDDDHDHKDISGTDWSGYLTLDGNVYPLNIPGTYTVKLYVKVDAGDPNWAEVDRATLVVEEPCYHPAAEIEEYWDQTTGINHKSISDTLHRSSGYKYKYCGACLSRVGSSYAVTVDEAHIFDAAGDCTLCDYKASCQHPNTKPVVDTSYHNKGEEGHLVVQYGNLVCTNANCGKEVEPYYAEEMKAHTFSGDTCSLCGYTEYSEMEVVVARDQTSAETGNEISAKATVQGGSGVFSYAWEVLCDGVVVHRTDYSMSSEYSYTADKAGKWSFRVYVKDDNTEEEIIETSSDITVSEAACPHTNSTPVSQDTEYIKLSDTAHEIRTFYINFCDSCGESTSGTYYQSENVAHAPDSSGHCVCGYVVPTETCQHTESLPQQIDQWINPYDETWHSVVTVYKDVCANTDCGVVLNAHREVDDKIAHSYDDAGKCVCGYVRPTDACDHAAADTLTDTSYTDLNESNHSVIRTYHYQCECGQVDYNDTKTTTEPHVFENGTCVCGRTEAVAITYGGNFSQDSYTMTVGEKLNVDVTASTTNANLSRVTINVDSTGNDRLAYADINGGTNWNGTLTLDGANAPLNVPGTYTIKLFVKVNNDDNAWAEVDQATLTVAEAAGCPHTSVEEYWEMTEGYSVTYKSISDTHHTASGHMYKFCTLCLSRVGDNYPVTIDEVHSFDAAGDCILCDYRVSCQHKETKPKVETSGYTSKGEEGHLFFQYGNRVCANANCSKEVEPYYAEEMQDHTFSDNTCSLCGYSKSEELSVVVARGQSSAETGDIISATATAKGGSGSYKYAWEVICEGVVVDSTDYSMPSSYSYVANDIGSWTFKVYVKDASTGDVVTATTSAITVDMAACPHDLINSIQQGEPQYIKISDTTHEIRTYYNDTCGVCGDVTRADYYKSETAAHNPDANGKCVCGYTAPTSTCDHANSIPQQIGQPTVEKYDEKWHEVIYIYKDVCANEACQTVLNEHREVREMVVHTFDANGKCACGYVLPTEDCDHVATKTELNPKYIPVDASCHHFIVTYHYECECGQVNYDEDAQSFDPHVYEGRICKLCDFENPCDHADFQKVISSVVEDDKNSNSTHFVVTTYTKTCECGAVNPTPIVRKAVPCSFTKSAGVQAKHESQGHQYFDRCECSNAVVNGKFKNYLSSCATCQQQYGDDALAKGNAANDVNKVKELQELLMQNGYALPNYGADGDFGGETVAAVEKFQRDHGLPVTGVVDDATWAKLNELSQETSDSDSGNKIEVEEEQPQADDTVYELRLQGAHISKSTNGSYVLVPKSEYAIAEVYDVTHNKFLSINETDLFIVANNGCSVNGLLCTFNVEGLVTLSLVRGIDGAVLDTLEVFVTQLWIVDDSMVYYYDQCTEIVLMEDMERVEWKYDSLLVTENVAMNDFEYDRSTGKVSFEAYNAGTMVYAVISYDKDGNEIERAYIEGYDAVTSIIKGGAETFWATGRVWDTKYQNDQMTKQTDVELTVSEGGFVRVMQPNEDEELLALNIAETFIRTWDLIDSASDAVKPVDMADATKLVKAIGKENIVKIATNLIKEGAKEWAKDVDAAGMYKLLLTDRSMLESFSTDFAYEITDFAKNMGIEVTWQVIDAIEDVGMLALNGASGGATGAMNSALNVIQADYDLNELLELEDDLLECMDGDMKVRIRSIEIPVE